MSTINKKEKILQSAISVFSKKGLENTKVSDIVKEAGIAQGTFYIYFSSKNALVPAIAEHMLNKLLLNISTKVDLSICFAEKIESLIDITFHVTAEYKKVLALCYSGLAISDGLEEWEKIYEPYYQWLDQVIEEAKEKREIREDINTRIATKMIIGLIESSAEQIYLFDKSYKDINQFRDELISFLHHALLK